MLRRARGAPQRLMPEERRSHAGELRSRPAGAAGRLCASAAGPPTDSQREADALSLSPGRQGWRAQMEDDHLHKLGLPDAPDVSLFGVYDGHGGDFVAHYVARKFPEHLSRAGTLRGSDADFATTATKAFETALMSIDAELLQQPEVESGQDQSGSTSVMTLISPKHIVCANTGAALPGPAPAPRGNASSLTLSTGCRLAPTNPPLVATPRPAATPPPQTTVATPLR